MTTRVAAIDCGTNSIRLLIADREPRPGGGLTDVVRQNRIVRLGEGVDRTGLLSPEAIARTKAALVDYADLIREHGATEVRMTATSATRDADNRSDFITMVYELIGVAPEVISGVEEASLSFLGAASALPDATGTLLVCDIGGGSTELVRGRLDGLLQSHSMEVGCVRLTERHLHDDPPTAEQVDAAVADVRDALARAAQDVDVAANWPARSVAHPDNRADGGRTDVDSAEVFATVGATSGDGGSIEDATGGPVTLIGVAGTITTLTGMILGLDTYDASRIHGATITADQIRDVTARLIGMTREDRTAVPVMDPGRVDVITAGAIVLRTIVDQLGAPEVVASEHDILDGIALSIGGVE